MALTVAVDVPPRDREVLESWLRAPSVRAGLAQRARIVLLAADGVAVKDIVERVGVSKPTVIGWKKRYATEGIGGLEDRPKPGRRRVVDEVAVVLGDAGAAARAAGGDALVDPAAGPRELGISHVWVGKIWRRWGLQPWRRRRSSSPPTRSWRPRSATSSGCTSTRRRRRSCSASTRSPRSRRWIGPRRPCRCGRGAGERQTHDYIRHGTTTLFAALEIATGQVEQACLPRHRHQEFLRFLKQVAKAYPRRKLHLVVDNYATHNHPAVRAWLARNPRITLHFTPTSGSWLNLVEVFFSIITRQAIRRGSFGSVKDLIAAIGAFIDGWNERCHPFVWTKTADELLDHCRPGQRTSFTRH